MKKSKKKKVSLKKKPLAKKKKAAYSAKAEARLFLPEVIKALQEIVSQQRKEGLFQGEAEVTLTPTALADLLRKQLGWEKLSTKCLRNILRCERGRMLWKVLYQLYEGVEWISAAQYEARCFQSQL